MRAFVNAIACVFFKNTVMNIRAKDVVLEIGSGHNPHNRSDLLCDKYLEDNSQRGRKIQIDRPLVVCDATFLPFRDKSFDYTIARHVLEHVDEPDRFFNELMRVSDKGYIETPSELSERISNPRPYHKWLVNKWDNKLCLKKTTESVYLGLGKLVPYMWENSVEYRQLHFTYSDLFLVRYEWQNQISYEILPSQDEFFLNFDDERTLENITRIDKRNKWKAYVPRFMWTPLKTGLSKLCYRQRKNINIADYIVCPLCKADLNSTGEEYICQTCRLKYPVRNGIPILLVGEATRANSILI